MVVAVLKHQNKGVYVLDVFDHQFVDFIHLDYKVAVSEFLYFCLLRCLSLGRKTSSFSHLNTFFVFGVDFYLGNLIFHLRTFFRLYTVLIIRIFALAKMLIYRARFLPRRDRLLFYLLAGVS